MSEEESLEWLSDHLKSGSACSHEFFKHLEIAGFPADDAMILRQLSLQLQKLTFVAKDKAATSSGRDWIHPPDTLQRGHIAYLVKFLGNTEVDQAKGIDVVKEGIRKLKFTSQIKKSEGTKPPKVELTISIDGVAIQEPKTKRILHQYPLHRISYCADDKAEKKFFSFIAKESESDKHMCFVFVSDKLAEEITLTIGQAFDLAYRRFLETSGRDLEMRKQLMILQKKIQFLEDENRDLKRQLQDLERIKSKPETDVYKQPADVYQVNGNVRHENQLLDGIPKPCSTHTSRPVPTKEVALSPSQELFNEFGTTLPTVGTKLENLDMDDFEDFNPRATNGNCNTASTVNGAGTSVPYIRPPPSLTNGNIFAQTPSHNNFGKVPMTTPVQQPQPQQQQQAYNQEKDLFGAEPFAPCVKTSNPNLEQNSGTTEDPFGMGDFGQVPSHLGAQELESAIGDLDKRLSEMRDGFSRGISFGNDDFSLESLDPLSVNKPA